MSDLKITGLHKHYGAYHAVKGIDLEVPSGEFTVLVGPSGCGKSTLLRTIAGLEEASAGTIEIGGKDVTWARPRDRDIAMVFQNYALYPYLNVYENIAFGLRARRVASAEVDKRVKRAAEMLGIAQLLERFPRELSGGQRQRVAIGRAIVRDALLFLFDEPLSNLDAQLRDDMRVEIKRLHQELGRTMIYVTHDQIEAMTLADRIALLRDGTKLTLPPGRKAPNGQAVVLGLRPQHIAKAGASAALGHVQLPSTIELVQPTGSRVQVSMPLGGISITAEFAAHEVTAPGKQVRIDIDMTRAVLIDPQTDKVI